MGIGTISRITSGSVECGSTNTTSSLRATALSMGGGVISFIVLCSLFEVEYVAECWFFTDWKVCPVEVKGMQKQQN
ncbi:MAG: hypothetical protein GAK29_04977 [Acinetobacter bereziniae]|uniref:Uncharacterized protein n=1 Tax=Acinetobacter bereziniae TaxID=106648 RepID=A0A833PAA3_ACIBZ|nr:MAG: hypothetical protein GAK29_04977 [Acinetobacter bereziniae]